MLEFFVRAPYARQRFRSSPVGSFVEGFATALREFGYCKRIGVSVLGHAVHLGVWALRKGRPASALDERAVDAFVAHLPRCRCPGQRASHAAKAGGHARTFVRYLRTSGIVAPIPALPPPSALVAGFCAWMLRQRGVAETTQHAYGRTAQQLVARLGEDPSYYRAAGVRAAVHEVGGGRGVGTAKHAAAVARALLRYLGVVGRCQPGLEASILPVAHRKDASLPRYVSAEDVQRIVDACDPQRRGGVRDRAILLLLARLGLRGGDIVRMRLCDLDWEGARLRVVGKGRREALLPLAQDVGDAIGEYLRIRPGIPSDRVFLRTRAPWRPLGGTPTVSAIVAQAVRRAGVVTPTCGSNLLRHSLATRLLREGVSLPAIGVVLRHRSIETTAHYAKVDAAMLSTVAQPWIGVGPC